MFQQLTSHINDDDRDCVVKQIRCGLNKRVPRADFQSAFCAQESQMVDVIGMRDSFWLRKWDLTPW
jgi:hypothetical protein